MPHDARQVNGVWELGPVDGTFGALYHTVRTLEHRILPDGIVRGLPRAGSRTAHPAEWRIRHRSLQRLLQVLAGERRTLQVLDIGCGNGWMSAALAHAGHTVMGLDVHRAELEQAARVFPSRNVTWCMGDPLHAPLPEAGYDVVVFAASLQYFDDMPALAQRVRGLLRPGGVVHVVDTMLYPDRSAAEAARERSRAHYARLGVEDLARRYQALTLADLGPLGALHVQHAPVHGPLARLMGFATPFHHVIARP
jgi:SAM-dependent methyltransferase